LLIPFDGRDNLGGFLNGAGFGFLETNNAVSRGRFKPYYFEEQLETHSAVQSCDLNLICTENRAGHRPF